MAKFGLSVVAITLNPSGNINMVVAVLLIHMLNIAVQSMKAATTRAAFEPAHRKRNKAPIRCSLVFSMASPSPNPPRKK